jgi:TM2 domain-containing membrane protein YozV
MDYFYMDEQSREIGPVPLETLKSFRLAGVIKNHTLVRPENSEIWVTAISVLETTEKSLPTNNVTLKPPEISGARMTETPPVTNQPVQSPVTFSQSEMIRFESEKKSAGLAFVLCWILGNFGAHRFYMKKPHAVTKLVIMLISIPLVFLFCLGYVGIFAMTIWSIVDLFYISGWVKEYNTALLTKIQSGQS